LRIREISSLPVFSSKFSIFQQKNQGFQIFFHYMVKKADKLGSFKKTVSKLLMTEFTNYHKLGKICTKGRIIMKKTMFTPPPPGTRS